MDGSACCQPSQSGCFMQIPFEWETGNVRDPAQKPREQEPATLWVPRVSLSLTTHGWEPPALFLEAFRVPQGATADLLPSPASSPRLIQPHTQSGLGSPEGWAGGVSAQHCFCHMDPTVGLPAQERQCISKSPWVKLGHFLA